MRPLSKSKFLGARASILPCAFAFVSVSVSAESRVFQAPQRSEQRQVVIVARGVAVHQHSREFEVFFGRFVDENRSMGSVIRLVDQFQDSENALSRSVVGTGQVLRMSITRDESCDQSASSTFLPRQEETILFADMKGSLRSEREAIIPCYQVRHEATRLAQR